jgi:hypothetical protein
MAALSLVTKNYTGNVMFAPIFNATVLEAIAIAAAAVGLADQLYKCTVSCTFIGFLQHLI